MGAVLTNGVRRARFLTHKRGALFPPMAYRGRSLKTTQVHRIQFVVRSCIVHIDFSSSLIFSAKMASQVHASRDTVDSSEAEAAPERVAPSASIIGARFLCAFSL